MIEKLLVFDRFLCRNKRKSIANSLNFAMKTRQKLAVEALFMLKKRRKEREDDYHEACRRMIVIMCKTLCINILAIYAFVVAAQSFSHLVIFDC